MRLSIAAQGLTDAGIDVDARGDAEITGVVHRTDAVTPGVLFCCVPGSHVDGHDLAADAVQSGARALLVERFLSLDVPQIRVASVRAAMGPLAARYWDDPSRSMSVIGITGTNGKTTTVSFLRSIMVAAGRRCEVIGTLSSQPGGPPTTPDAPELQAQLAQWKADGVDVVVMEVSSHALALGRVAGIWFAATGFTMLGHDHLDFHGTVEQYFAAKALLFQPTFTDYAAVRADDPWGARLLAESAVTTEGFSLDDAHEVQATPIGMTFQWRGGGVSLPLVGSHNVANALCAATIASHLDLDTETITRGLTDSGVVVGRFELVDAGQAFTVAVDYAHTPDALETVLAAAREMADAQGGRVIVVFGCGGDKDRAKRPEMGRIAAESADVVVVTSDNPRSEEPQAIVDEILAGITDLTGITVELDRRLAIHHAARVAEDHDVVVIAGKGHETTQTFADRVIPFDDRAVVREVLAS